VAYALFANKSLGCGWLGGEERGVTLDVVEPVSGQSYTVEFDRPELVPVRAVATVRVIGASTVDYQSVVRGAIVDYANGKLEGLRGFVVGAPVSPFEMAAAVNIVEPSIFVLSLIVGPFDADANELQPVTMPLEIWQRATITAGSIEVIGA
jgi:hypothetical protein